MALRESCFVYILASEAWGTLYVGVTNDIERRVFEHKQGIVEGFTQNYGVKMLVYYEEHASITEAIHRDKRLKKWPRAWKVNLSRTDNPDWQELASDWYQTMTKEEIGQWLAEAAKV